MKTAEIHMLHTDVINDIIRQLHIDSYLEVGTFNRAHNFDQINCARKYCVDPDPNAKADFIGTSDAFFKQNTDRFGLIFIDGLHHKDQVEKDFINANMALSDGGIVCMHDTNPPTEITTCVPRGSQREWCGDVYEFICKLDGDFRTVMADYGLTMVGKLTCRITDKKYSWQEFSDNRATILRPIPVSEVKNWLTHY